MDYPNVLKSLGVDASKPDFRAANNKGADQPGHVRSLISVVVIRLMENIISKLATSEISVFYLVSVAEQTRLCVTWSESPRTGFLTSRSMYIL